MSLFQHTPMTAEQEERIEAAAQAYAQVLAQVGTELLPNSSKPERLQISITLGVQAGIRASARNADPDEVPGLAVPLFEAMLIGAGSALGTILGAVPPEPRTMASRTFITAFNDSLHRISAIHAPQGKG